MSIVKEVVGEILTYKPLDDCHSGVIVHAASSDYEPGLQVKTSVYTKSIRACRFYGDTWMTIKNLTQMKFMLIDGQYGEDPDEPDQQVYVVWWQGPTEPVPFPGLSFEEEGKYIKLQSHYQNQDKIRFSIKRYDRAKMTPKQFAALVYGLVKSS